MINLPSNNQEWNQANQSDLFGNIHVTKNITFDTEGYLRVSYSPRSVMNASVDADFTQPAVILYNATYGYFVETWDEPFQVSTSILLTRPTQITAANHPNGDPSSDAIWFGSFMAVTEANDVHYESGGTWTDTNISLTSSGQHPLKIMYNLAGLAVADVNTVKLYATPLTATPTLLTTLTIMSDFQITGMCYFNQNLYIGTQHIKGGHALMYVWNGQGTAAQQSYEVDSNVIFDICVHQDAVVLVTGNGSLLQFNGSGFTKLDAFPVFYTDQALNDDTNIGMYHNMLKSNGELLYINFNNSANDSDRLLSQPDGVWCYDPRVGLYHRYSLSNSLVNIETITTASVNTTTNQITVTSGAVTGTEVYYNAAGSTVLTPLTDNAKYFTIQVDATHIKLALTKEDAEAGTAIDLTGTGNNSQKLVFYPNVDFGQYFTARTMALYPIERPVSNRQYGTDLLWAGEVIRRDNAANYGTLGTVSTGVEARGYFITPKIFSDEVTDEFDLVTLKFSEFTSELDKIIIKYRTEDDMRQYINLSDWDMTWTSTTTFTSTETGWADAEVGNEVEVLQGAGGGLLAHITTISENAGTYTITLDETYDNYTTGDIGKAIFRNWIKWKTIEYGDSNALQRFLADHLGESGKWLQLKLEIRGIQTRIEELLVDNRYRLPSKDK